MQKTSLSCFIIPYLTNTVGLWGKEVSFLGCTMDGIVRGKSIWQLNMITARFVLWTVLLPKNCNFLKSINTVTVMQLVWSRFFFNLCFWVITNFFFKIMKSYLFLWFPFFCNLKGKRKARLPERGKEHLTTILWFSGRQKLCGRRQGNFLKGKTSILLILYYHSLCLPHLKTLALSSSSEDTCSVVGTMRTCNGGICWFVKITSGSKNYSFWSYASLNVHISHFQAVWCNW